MVATSMVEDYKSIEENIVKVLYSQIDLSLARARLLSADNYLIDVDVDIDRYK